jgi:hypothetical protein
MEKTMFAKRMEVLTSAVMPLMAALPFILRDDEPEPIMAAYDPLTQTTVFAGRSYSTCRYDESVGGILSKSRSDTQKDD